MEVGTSVSWAVFGVLSCCGTGHTQFPTSSLVTHLEEHPLQSAPVRGLNWSPLVHRLPIPRAIEQRSQVAHAPMPHTGVLACSICVRWGVGVLGPCPGGAARHSGFVLVTHSNPCNTL